MEGGVARRKSGRSAAVAPKASEQGPASSCTAPNGNHAKLPGRPAPTPLPGVRQVHRQRREPTLSNTFHNAETAKCFGGCWCLWPWLSPGHMVSGHTRRCACYARARLGGAALAWPHSVCLSGSANAFAGASLCGTRSPMRQTSARRRSLQLRGGGAVGASMAETSTGKVEEQ